jgi:sec-independent protein translocase protein TatB
VFGVSFLEVAVVALVALVIVGPQKLPAMMRTAGEWIGKLRRLTSDVRAQTGIDDILREEGIDGVAELRTLLRGQYNLRNVVNPRSSQWSSSQSQSAPQPPDHLLEFPVEGADCASALADDLISDAKSELKGDEKAEVESQMPEADGEAPPELLPELPAPSTISDDADQVEDDDSSKPTP